MPRTVTNGAMSDEIMEKKNSLTTTTKRTRTDKQHIGAMQLDERIDHGDRITRRHIELQGAETDESNYPKQESGNWKDVAYQQSKNSEMLIRKSQNDDVLIFLQRGIRKTACSNLQAYDIATKILDSINAVTKTYRMSKGHKYIRWIVRSRSALKKA